MKRQRTSMLMVVFLIVAMSCRANASQASNPQDDNASSATWGGTGISMEMTSQGATLEFDCAQGAVLQAIRPNANGEFSVAGTFTPQRGGAIQKDNPPRELPATYKGTIHGDTMELEIVLNQKDIVPPPFTLTRGTSARLHKCR